MTTTVYNYDRYKQLRAQREAKLAVSKQVLARAKAENRELHAHENEALEANFVALKAIDAEIADQSKAMTKAVLALPGQPGDDDSTGFVSLRTPGVKSDLTTRFGSELGTPGLKSLVDLESPYTSIPMDPTPYRIEQAPTSFLEVLPAINRGVVYRYLRQTARANNAAPVAPGGLKPTSSYALEPVDGRLHVIAHVSEPIDKYGLSDGASLAEFVQLEMVDGLHDAVEGQLIHGDGTGENLRGIANTPGIQTQALVTNPILTARAAITKVEVLGYTPYYFVLNPLDWEAVETTQLDAGQFVLNGEGSRNGVPVDMAARRLWGVPVTVTTGVPAGTGWLLSSGVAQVATDGGLHTEWSSAIDDDFGRNQVRLRVEGRFDLAVTRPLGIVKLTLTS